MKHSLAFDVDALLIVAKVIELRSLSAAADVLGVPRSTVSRKLNKLESDIGAKLLRKNTRRVTVTDLGERLYKHAAGVQAEVDAIRAVLGGTREDPQGVLRVAMPVFMGVEFAGTVGAAFLRRYPKAKLEVKLVDTTMHPVKEGYDVTLAYGPLQDSSLIGRKLFTIESVLCAAPAFLAELGVTIAEPLDLERLPFVDVSDGSKAPVLRLRKAKRQAEVRPDSRAQANNYQIGKQYVMQGIGIGALPTHICREQLANGALVPILTEWSLKTKEVYVIYPFQLSQSGLIQAFYEVALDTIRSNESEARRVAMPCIS